MGKATSASGGGSSKSEHERLSAEISDLRRELTELKSQLTMVSQRVYDAPSEVVTDRLVVSGAQGVVEIGQIGENYFGMRVSGRGECSGLSSWIVVDDGGHSLPRVARAQMSIEGASGMVVSELPSQPLGAPSTAWESARGDRTEITFVHGGYNDDLEAGERVDVDGSWYGHIELADLTGHKPAVIEANLLDDLVRHADVRDGKWWRSSHA